MSKQARRRFQYPGEICRPEERLTETLERTVFESIPIPGVQLSALAELEKVLRPMGVSPQPRKGTVPQTIVPLLVQEIKNSKYKNISFSTAIGVVDEPLGLSGMGIVGDAMTVLAVGGGFTYKMNNSANDSTTAVAGLVEDQFEIGEIYVTGLGAGTGQIRVNWNPDMIRILP